MIYGIGIDIVDIERVRRLLTKSRDAFLSRVFTLQEQEEASLRIDEATYFAGRWAGKEAASKALGCGIGAKVAMLDIEICKNEHGAPILTLHGKALDYAKECGITTNHISISHEQSYAVANVIFEITSP